jgi:hypothetical protein
MERIAYAAIILADGQMFIGRNHASCISSAAFANPNDRLLVVRHKDGFLTDSGRFVKRVAALKIARRAKPYKQFPKHQLDSSDLI